MPNSLLSSCSAALRQFLAGLLGVALLLSSGLRELDWQGYAWAKMLWERSPEMGLQAAIDDTFSGENPCPHCLEVQASLEKKSQEKQPSAPSNSENLRLLVPLVAWSKEAQPVPTWQDAASAAMSNFAEEGILATLWSGKPALPPPRAAV